MAVKQRRLSILPGSGLIVKMIEDFALNKREQFVLSVAICSIGIFLSENFFNNGGIIIAFVFSFLSAFLLYLTMRKDLEDNLSAQIFILPFFFTLAFGLFYFLVPGRYLTRIVMTSLYALGLYSLYLSQNIFIVSSIRTIALLSGARTVSFVITVVSYFFLSDVLFSLHLNIFFTVLLFFFFSFPLILYSLWTYTLAKPLLSQIRIVLPLAICTAEVALTLWFWPSTPTIIALFLSGFFYTIVGLSHIWIEKRLFRGVIWEYIWVAGVIGIIFFFFTSWS